MGHIHPTYSTPELLVMLKDDSEEIDVDAVTADDDGMNLFSSATRRVRQVKKVLNVLETPKPSKFQITHPMASNWRPAAKPFAEDKIPGDTLSLFHTDLRRIDIQMHHRKSFTDLRSFRQAQQKVENEIRENLKLPKLGISNFKSFELS